MADSLLGGIVINEILADPNGAANFDTDGNGTADHTDEFVELMNTSTTAIDISGLELWDGGVGNWFTFPPGTILQPGAHAMVIVGVQSGGSLPTGAAGDLFFDAGRGAALINNGGDNVVLYDPANDQYIAARFNGVSPADPTAGSGGFSGFSGSATQSGSGENFGKDIDGYSIQRSPDGSNTFVNNQTPTPGTSNLCFTGGTLFDTPQGLRPIEALRPGDLLLTRDHGPQPIRWIWARRRSAAELRDNPRMLPVRIARDALGPGLPARDLSVSQQHRILITSQTAVRIFGRAEVLAPAKDLTGVPGIAIDTECTAVTYYHILLDSHQILYADGLAAESLYLGPFVLRTLDRDALRELRDIFGADFAPLVSSAPEPARLLVRGRRVRQLMRRHPGGDRPPQLSRPLGATRRDNGHVRPAHPE